MQRAHAFARPPPTREVYQSRRPVSRALVSALHDSCYGHATKRRGSELPLAFENRRGVDASRFVDYFWAKSTIARNDMRWSDVAMSSAFPFDFIRAKVIW